MDTYGYTGSYSSIRRFLQQLKDAHPDVTTVLDFDPGDVAQVDFGRGPTIQDVFTRQSIATWIFVMVLAWSRHQYAEIVPDQKVETWLSCHRSAFEFFGGVPARVVIDNPKNAITRACYHDPECSAPTASAPKAMASPSPRAPCETREEGARGGGREVCPAQLCAFAPVP